jgi:transposase
MAQAFGGEQRDYRRIWHAHGLQPHRVRPFEVSRDKWFTEKLTDVVGLYLNPPDKALVLFVDEKSKIQALDRTQPGLPSREGRCGTMTHGRKAHGTTTLFAAPNALVGTAIGTCYPRHRNREFRKFLPEIGRRTPPDVDLHLIVDNYGTHTHPRAQQWLAIHPRFHLHFTPTSSSWLNLVEQWFKEHTSKRIRCGVFKSAADLIAAIKEYIVVHNAHPKPFVWTKSAEAIQSK